jgi:large subunit ribosomal protein L30e
MEEIKKLLGSEKLVIGTDRVLKAVRDGSVQKVILATNAPASLKEQLDHFMKVAPFALEEAGMSNDELGTFCKKPFSIAALAILN